MKLSVVAEKLAGQLQGQDAEFTFVSTDTRTLKPGELFIALKGPQFDGHQFIQQAEQKGAVAVVVSEKVETSLPVFSVSNTHQALGKIAELKRSEIDIPLIALTGSCGKTSVKEMIRLILSECGLTLANQGTLNNDIGVPLTLLKLTPEYEYAVIEMGANHSGEIAYLTAMAQPTVAFINNIAPAHLEGFGSIEGVAAAKFEIFQGLKEDGIALINADDHYAEWITQKIKNKKIIRFGIEHEDVDITATDIRIDAKGYSTFTLKTPLGETSVNLHLIGRHNILNALAAATASYAVGATLKQIQLGLEKASAVPGRLVTYTGLNGARIIDDTYNANPFSVKAALKVLSDFSGERVFVLGDMGELGGDAVKWHQEVGLFAKEIGIQYFYACGELSRFAVQTFGVKAQHFNNQQELGVALQRLLNPTMTVLVKGSRSAKMENVLTQLIQPIK